MTRASKRRTRRYVRTGSRRIPRNRPRPNYLLLFCTFALAAAAGVGIFCLMSSPRLNVKSVDIKGVRLADMRAVEAAASRATGHNIILARTGPIIAQVSRLSEVRLVKMGRRFPDRMWLRVWERKPAAVLATARGFFLVQSDGLVFHKLSAPPGGVCVIELAADERFAPGRMVRSSSARSALEALRIARAKAIRLGKISVDPQGDICLNMGSDFCVELGGPDDIAHKMSLLRNALARRPSMVREGGYINLSVPSNPAWRPKAASPAS
jgi:cell division protein FtsQ